jgi:hypothetical protein
MTALLLKKIAPMATARKTNALVFISDCFSFAAGVRPTRVFDARLEAAVAHRANDARTYVFYRSRLDFSACRR